MCVLITTRLSTVMQLTEINDDRSHYFKTESGKFHGEYKSWYENGQMQEHSLYNNGEITGEHKLWFENGMLYRHACYNNGEPHGEHKLWYENGHLRKHMFYANSVYAGEFKLWDSSGNLVTHKFYNGWTDITNRVKKIVANVNSIADEERMLIKLTWGIECLPK